MDRKQKQVRRIDEWESWLLFLLNGISSQSLDAIARIERRGRLRAVYEERLTTERAAWRLMQVLDVLFERPILNIRQLEASMDVPYRTAQRYVERLEEIGILREVKGGRRNRLYRNDNRSYNPFGINNNQWQPPAFKDPRLKLNEHNSQTSELFGFTGRPYRYG